MSFTRKTRAYLEELSRNNNRGWFEAHRDDYERFVREPAFEFIRAMEEPLRKMAPHFRADARKAGGSLMRVFRDTRFSPDKTPYKTNVGIQFRHGFGKDVHAPGYYVHIASEECFIGVGSWRPESAVLRRFREAIANAPEVWFKTTRGAKLAAQFSLAGESLTRPPQGYPADHTAIEDLKRKDLLLSSPLSWAEVIGPDFPEIVAARFALTTPFMRFLCESLGLPF